MEKDKVLYNRRTWLCPRNNYSSSSIVAYDGERVKNDEMIRTTFVNISDCNNSIWLSRKEGDSFNDYIKKISNLRDELDRFINYLKTIK